MFTLVLVSFAHLKREELMTQTAASHQGAVHMFSATAISVSSTTGCKFRYETTQTWRRMRLNVSDFSRESFFVSLWFWLKKKRFYARWFNDCRRLQPSHSRALARLCSPHRWFSPRSVHTMEMIEPVKYRRAENLDTKINPVGVRAATPCLLRGKFNERLDLYF